MNHKIKCFSHYPHWFNLNLSRSLVPKIKKITRKNNNFSILIIPSSKSATAAFISLSGMTCAIVSKT